MLPFVCVFSPGIVFDLLKPDVVFFDLDDTLLDHLGAERQAQMQVWQTFGELQSVAATTWISSYSDYNKHLWQRYGAGEISRSELQTMRFRDVMSSLGLTTERSATIGDYYLEVYEQYWQWNPGAEAAWNLVRAHGRTGIITNGFSQAQTRKFERFNLNKAADLLIISENVGVPKPNPAIFDYAARLAGCRPENLLYIGDNYIADIEGGAAAGWKTAWYNPGHVLREDNCADFTFFHFDELSNFLQISP